MVLKLSRLPAGEPEVFTTIQGEGVSAGVPSTFVRLSLCSLRCVWCDTKFTWDWERYDPRVEIVRLDVPEVTRRVLAGGTRNVVITGGEPLLQQEEVARPGGGAEGGRAGAWRWRPAGRCSRSRTWRR